MEDAPNWLKTFDGFYGNEADGKFVDHMMKSLQEYYPENRVKKRWAAALKHYHIERDTDIGVIQGLRRVVNTWSRFQATHDSQYHPLPRLLTGLLDQIRWVFDHPGTLVASYIWIIEAIVDHFLEGTATVGRSPAHSPSSQATNLSFRCDEHILTRLEKLAIQLERLYLTTENQARPEIIQNIPEIIKKILIASSLSNTILERWSYQHGSELRRVRDLPDCKNSFEEVVPVPPANGPLM